MYTKVVLHPYCIKSVVRFKARQGQISSCSNTAPVEDGSCTDLHREKLDLPEFSACILLAVFKHLNFITVFLVAPARVVDSWSQWLVSAPSRLVALFCFRKSVVEVCLHQHSYCCHLTSDFLLVADVTGAFYTHKNERGQRG